MAIPAVLTALFDSKLRQARKGAKNILRAAKNLQKPNALGTSAKRLSKEASKEISTARSALEESLGGNDAAATTKRTDQLSNVLKKHGVAPTQAPKKGDSWMSIVMAVMAALTLRAFVFEAFKIPSGSMIPTLAIGDQIFVNKYVYGVRIPFTTKRMVDFSVPERGDVVVFIFPEEPHEDYIKRVVGLPGDEIEVRGGTVFLNGSPVPRRALEREAYWDRDRSGRWHPFEAHTYEERFGGKAFEVLQDVNTPPSAHDFAPRLIPEGHLFVMGDNRDNSHDSRAWGFVPLENVVGRAMFVWWSWGKDGLDTSRLGTWIN